MVHIMRDFYYFCVYMVHNQYNNNVNWTYHCVSGCWLIRVLMYHVKQKTCVNNCANYFIFKHGIFHGLIQIFNQELSMRLMYFIYYSTAMLARHDGILLLCV